MLNKIMTTAVLMAGATLALAQNAPPAAGAGGGQGAGRMDPAARFKELDKNNDGKLSLEEFSTMTAGRAGGGAAGGGGASGAAGAAAPAAMSMADRFKAADTNKDGSLTVEELTAYMQSMRGAGRSGGGTGGGGMGGGGMGGG